MIYTTEKQIKEDLTLYKSIEKNCAAEKEIAVHFTLIKDLLALSKIQSLIVPKTGAKRANKRGFMDVMELRLEQAVDELSL